jgi:hypothetical protein
MLEGNTKAIRLQAKDYKGIVSNSIWAVWAKRKRENTAPR